MLSFDILNHFDSFCNRNEKIINIYQLIQGFPALGLLKTDKNGAYLQW